MVPVGPGNSVLLHAANTSAILDFDFYEAIIAPLLTPRVLQLPVVYVALCIRFSFFSLFFAAYPPVSDATLFDCLTTGAFGVSNSHHAVVNRSTIFFTVGLRCITALFQSTAFVESELFGNRKCYGTWLYL